MLRSEIQSKTGLTRKAIEYYEEREIIKPRKLENGYRDYSEEDLEILSKVSLYRKLGISVAAIEEIVLTGINSLASILRKRQHQQAVEEKQRAILALILAKEKQEVIDEKLALIENEEMIYQRLERAFPGYFGQMIFSAYQAFLNEPLREGGEEAFAMYITFLDNLPPFLLTKEEQAYIEDISSSLDTEKLSAVNHAKIEAVKNFEKWQNEHKEDIARYEEFKKSEEYLQSPMKQIQDKLLKFMSDNRYYEVAIPLIRKFSRSYDEYYSHLLEANEKYIRNTK